MTNVFLTVVFWIPDSGETNLDVTLLGVVNGDNNNDSGTCVILIN